MIRQLAAHDIIDECAFAERPIGDDSNAFFQRQRQKPAFSLAVGKIVSNLNKIERMVFHDTLNVIVTKPGIARDADISKTPFGFHLK